MQLPEYREELSSQIPAAQLLIALGYTYLSPQQALALRGERTRNVILSGISSPGCGNIITSPYAEKNIPLTDSAIQEALRRISDVPLVDGLKKASQSIYELISLSGFQPPRWWMGIKKTIPWCISDLTYPDEKRLSRHRRVRRRARRLAPDPPPGYRLLCQRHPLRRHRM